MKNFKNFWKSKTAQGGGLYIFIIALALFSFLYICLSMFMDQLITISNEFMTEFPMTQERATALEFCFHFWYVLPVIILLSLVIWLIKNALRSRAGMVE